MGKDVTSLFETYRECARHLRNTYYSTRDSKDWDTIDDFGEVAKVLFAHLVLQRLADDDDRAFDRAVEERRLLIVPKAGAMPLMISRQKNGGGYWDHPIKVLECGDAKVAFRTYFDWDQHDLIDFRYYHGLIIESAKYPDIVEHEALIETIYGRIIFEPN